MDDTIDTNIDSNQHPVVDPSPELQSLETPQNGIQNRFRALEAVNSVRVRRLQPRQRVVHDPVSNLNGGCRMNVSYLEKALEMNKENVTEDKRVSEDGKGNYFDCNVCLGMARDPVLTCCGHLFCWECFYKVPYVDSISKECPVCKGEVIDSKVVPIYGNGNGTGKRASGPMIPPRPRAHRVESVRQENLGQEVHHMLMANAVRRIRVGLGMVQETGPSQSVNDLGPTSNVAATTVVHLGALPTNRAVEIDVTISHSIGRRRRRRGVSPGLNLEGESSLEFRRRLR